MPSYNSAEQQGVLSSILRAVEVLETHGTGPALQERIEALRPALQSVARAQTDRDLADAVNASGIEDFFGRVSPVLQYHALNDTDGVGAAAWRGVSGWASMTVPDPEDPSCGELEDETEAWLFARYVRKIAETGPAYPVSMQSHFSHVAPAYATIAAGDSGVAKVQVAHAVRCARQSPDDDKPVTDFFFRHDLGARQLMLWTARIGAGMDPETERSSSIPPPAPASDPPPPPSSRPPAHIQ